MSKKTFSQGLDDLFSSAHEEQVATAHPPERRPAHKNFLTDIDALLQEALEESLERYESGQPDTPTPGSGKTKATGFRSPVTGLDALIRQTIDVQEITTDEATGKKRLTVSVDKTKVEKLKSIARLENSYLKDLLVQLIDSYIEEYTQQKGIDL